MAGGSYRELPVPAHLAALVEAVWVVTTPTAVEDWLVLPDGCVDLVLTAGCEPVVAGPATTGIVLPCPAGTHIRGVRLRPGAAPAVFGVGADELLDRNPLLADVVGARAARMPTGLVDWVAAAAGPPDPVSRHTADLLRADPTLGLPDLRRAVLSSERALRRRFTREVGYGPKRFARVMRLQEFLRQSRTRPDRGLGALAAAAGYADQAHLTREVRDLAGRTPTGLLAQRASVTLD